MIQYCGEDGAQSIRDEIAKGIRSIAGRIARDLRLAPAPGGHRGS